MKKIVVIALAERRSRLCVDTKNGLREQEFYSLFRFSRRRNDDNASLERCNGQIGNIVLIKLVINDFFHRFMAFDVQN